MLSNSYTILLMLSHLLSSLYNCINPYTSTPNPKNPVRAISTAITNKVITNTSIKNMPSPFYRISYVVSTSNTPPFILLGINLPHMVSPILKSDSVRLVFKNSICGGENCSGSSLSVSSVIDFKNKSLHLWGIPAQRTL